VFSKAMCWAALDRGLRLAEHHSRPIPEQGWRQEADAIRAEVFDGGFSPDARSFTQAIGEPHLDASALLLPASGIIAADDPRMVHTTDAIMRELDRDGLILRYSSPDGLAGDEGAFLPCTFWLSEILAAQDRPQLAHRYFRRACSTANDLGLFSEEWEVGGEAALGNYPQAMTHLAHISAGLALEDMDRRLRRSQADGGG
jgi:GH15 family glucan-1,4-alpha-glucosidase